MSLLRPLDPSFPIERQIAIEAGPVVLVNVVTLDKADEQTFLKTWQDDAAFMKRQASFISSQLHRALGESPTYLNYAVSEIDRSLPGCIRASGVQSQIADLSLLGRRFSTPVPEGRGAQHLRRIVRGRR